MANASPACCDVQVLADKKKNATAMARAAAELKEKLEASKQVGPKRFTSDAFAVTGTCYPLDPRATVFVLLVIVLGCTAV